MTLLYRADAPGSVPVVPPKELLARHLLLHDEPTPIRRRDSRAREHGLF
jgi:hypothetical protein